MNDTPTPAAVIGGGGMHPSLAWHVQQQALPQPAAPSTPTKATTPALSGDGCHLVVAKHLQGR